MDEIYARNLNWNEFDGKTAYISGSYGMLASYMVYFLVSLPNSLKKCVCTHTHSKSPMK